MSNYQFTEDRLQNVADALGMKGQLAKDYGILEILHRINDLREIERFPLSAVQDDVWAFNEAADTPMRAFPGFVKSSELDLALKLIDEEREELKQAVADGDLVETADAMGDLIYVVLGLACRLGIDMGPVFAEIQRSNMTKVSDSGKIERREDGKIIKPPHYSPPNIVKIIREQFGGI